MGRTGIRGACIVSAFSMLSTLAAGQASAAELRFVHAVPAVSAAALEADGRAVGGPVSFGNLSAYTRVANGSVELKLYPAGGSKKLASSRKDLDRGRWTAVAWQRDGKTVLSLFKDGAAKSGRVRLRAIQVAGELGKAAFEVDGRKLASLSPGQASDYDTLDPGTYDLGVARASGGGGMLASRSDVSLSAGTAETAFVVGSGGKPTRILLASDTSVAPSKAPGTGLGGLSGGTPWVLVLAAALAAGALGGAAYTLATGRRRGA